MGKIFLGSRKLNILETSCMKMAALTLTLGWRKGFSSRLQWNWIRSSPSFQLTLDSHLSGRNIWKFNSDEASHLVSSWNKKVIYELPWATHRWVLEEITRSNLKFIPYTRFIKFINSINKSRKPAVKFLYSMVASDVRSMTGSNLRSILLHTGVHVVPGTKQGYLVKKQRCFKVPEVDE